MDRKPDMANPKRDIGGSANGSRPLPTISIVTPSLNQARFLPDCISSIANQSYKGIEHIIVDPGSTDGSREIAAKAPSVTLMAEPDRGQSDAICKGFAIAEGDVLAWLNSDDRYADGSVFAAVAERFAQPDAPDVVYGLANYIDEHGIVIKPGVVNTQPEALLESFEYQVGVIQPSVFMRRSVFEKVGGPLIDLHFAMDYEYWIRIALAGFKWAFVPMLIAEARWWPEMKTGSQRGESYAEIMKVVLTHFGYVHKKWVDKYAEYLTSGADGIITVAKHRTPDTDVLVSSKKRELYGDYNTTYNTIQLLEASQDRHTIADTVRDMNAHGVLLHRHASPGDKAGRTKNECIPPSMASNRPVPGFYYYYAQETGTDHSLIGYEISDGFHWLFDRDWVERQLERFRLATPSIRRDRGTDTCIIVGNGPSLNSTNLELLEGHDIIISNFAYLNKRLLGLAKYYTVVNHLVAEQGSYEINRLKSVAKFFPFWLAGFVRADEHTYFTNALLEREFSTNATDWLSWNSTVSFFNMQLAYTLGYRKVLLVGFDHNYKQGTNLKEGAIIDQKGDDEDHFDPSYFRGKVWQAPDTANMAHVYQLARDAFEADGREIVNCTVGGKLEVFKRSTLEEELSTGIVSTYSYGKDSDDEAPSAEHPKVLIIDFTRMDGESATGQLKGTLFAGWPADRLMQVYSEGKGIFGVYRPAETGFTARVTASAKELAVTCESFAPDVILYRPVDTDPHIHDFTLKIIDRLNVPLITYIVDDWPARLKEERPKLHEKLDASLRSLFARSYACLSICDAMSIAFRERYGVSFAAMANCVDPGDWIALDRERRQRVSPGEPFLIRYSGALAKDKELQGVADVAQVVDSLQDEGVDVRLEVHTMPNWRSKLRLFTNLKGVSTDASFLPQDEYRRFLIGCDALLLAYTFDEETIRYMRYSMANSLPEAMASGVPIIAYGPPEVATMAYAASGQFAVHVAERDRSKLRDAILELVSHPEHGKELGSKARELAFEHHNSGRVRERFQSLLCEAAGQREKPEIREPPISAGHPDLVGPFERRLHAGFNENKLTAALLSSGGIGRIMIDVGAHRGASLAPFLKLGWRAFAFEPDPSNRAILTESLGSCPNLSVDDRAVTDYVSENVPFFTSNESSGISSLHPFDKSHEETCTVSTTTIADFVREKGLHHIDYLKIDAEGYDLSVLKGVPWDRIKPDLIMCEFEDSKTRSLGYTMHDMAHYLIERGYRVVVSEWHPVIRYGTKHDWHRLAPYPCELSHPDAWGNLIAFRSEADLQEIATAAKNIVKIDAEMAKRGSTRVTRLTRTSIYRRLVGYLKIHYPTIITIGRFGMWGLAKLKKTLPGAGGVALLVIVGLYVAGALVEPLRWYLVGIATALLLLFGGLLALSYFLSWLNRFGSDQRRTIRDSRAQVQTVLDGLKKSVSASETTLAELKKEISDSKETLAKMNVGNFLLFQPFNRRLTNEGLKHFAAEWVPKLGLNLDSRALAYMAHRICLAEDTCIGRLAGNIGTMLLRVLVARSVKEPDLEVLEIGTLFGVGAAMIHENCRAFFSSVHITIIDPLGGYYGSDQLDIVTGMPVTRDLFVQNMQRMNIPKSNYTIIEKLSTEDEAIEQASKRRYNLLIIDGDHSYSGVQHDFYHYRHLVERGGYIIFDDYGNPNWPEIQDFVDKEVVGLPELELVGTDVFAAVFRVIGAQNVTRQSATTVATGATKDQESRVSGSLEDAKPLEVRDVQSSATMASDMQFSIDYPADLEQRDGTECVLRFGDDSVYVSADHFRTVEDNHLKRELLKKSVRRVAIEVFSYCNRQCWFCPNASGQRRNQQHHLDEDIYIRILSDLSKVDYGQLFMFHLYNEPLADSIILKRIRQAKRFVPRAKLQINTNGDYLDGQYLGNLVEAGVSKVEINIYGPNNRDFIEDHILDNMHLMADKLGLQHIMYVNQPGNRYSMQSVCSGTAVTIMGRNFDKIGFDRGGLVKIENAPPRTSPCFAPVIDLDIDYRGNFLPCCNIYCDDERHKGYATGNLHDGRSIFEHYTDKQMVSLRKRLFQYYPDVRVCQTCSRKEFPELATDANVKDVNELYEDLNRLRRASVNESWAPDQ